MLKLVDLIKQLGIVLDDNYKIHCASGIAAQEAMIAFETGTWKEWQEVQNQKNFPKKSQILSLIHQGRNSWLFSGVFQIMDIIETESAECVKYRYQTEEVDGLESLTGRAIIDFKKDFRNAYPNGASYGDQLFISEIRKEKVLALPFPGFSDVRIDFLTLKKISEMNCENWTEPLKSVRGIYLISDKKTGGQYVGSASGEEGIWQRWINYRDSGDGGNKKLLDLLKEGENRQNDFQFSILETFGNMADFNFISNRESYWKDVLLTRGKFGLNS